MAAKPTTKKRATRRAPAPALPPGVKPSTLRLPASIRKLIRDDRGIASGGRNIVQRSARSPAVAR